MAQSGNNCVRLTRSYTRLINQIRSALMGTYPAFEHVLREQIIHRKWILHLLAKYGGPTKIKRLGKSRTKAFARKYRARTPEPIVDAMFAAISSHTIDIAGAHYAELGAALSAKGALLKLEHRKEIESQVIDLITEIPHTELFAIKRFQLAHSSLVDASLPKVSFNSHFQPPFLLPFRVKGFANCAFVCLDCSTQDRRAIFD